MASDPTTHVRITPEQWQAFITARHRPVKRSQLRDDQAQKLDTQLLSFSLTLRKLLYRSKPTVINESGFI